MSDLKYVNIGFPKCASSTLQKNIFLKHPELRMFGKVDYGEMGADKTEIRYDHEEVNDELTKYVYPLFSSIDTVMENHYDSYILKSKEILSEIDKKYDEKFIFSWEGIVNNAFVTDRKLRAERIKKIFGKVKIIIVIRNQLDAIRSVYDHRPYNPLKMFPGLNKKSQKVLSLEDWLNISYEFPHRSSINLYRYYEIINIYKSIFGKENIGIFLFENLVKEKRNFSDSLSDFLEIDNELTFKFLNSKRAHSNKPHSKFFHILLNMNKRYHFSNIMSNSLLKPAKKMFGEGSGHKSIVSDEWKKKLSNIYADENKKLQKEYSLEIDKYNYPGFN